MKFFNETKPAGNQDAFTKMLLWLVRPNAERCLGRNDVCAYRSRDLKNACVVGTLLPNVMAKQIDSAFQEKTSSIEYVINSEPKVKEWLENCTVELLTKMQEVHDSKFFTDNKLTAAFAIKRIAKDFGLTIPDKVKEVFEKEHAITIDNLIVD